MARQSVELFDALETAIIEEMAKLKAAGHSRNSVCETNGIKAGLMGQINRRLGDYSLTKLLDVCDDLGIVVKFDVQ